MKRIEHVFFPIRHIPPSLCELRTAGQHFSTLLRATLNSKISDRNKNANPTVPTDYEKEDTCLQYESRPQLGRWTLSGSDLFKGLPVSLYMCFRAEY